MNLTRTKNKIILLYNQITNWDIFLEKLKISPGMVWGYFISKFKTRDNLVNFWFNPPLIKEHQDARSTATSNKIKIKNVSFKVKEMK